MFRLFRLRKFNLRPHRRNFFGALGCGILGSAFSFFYVAAAEEPNDLKALYGWGPKLNMGRIIKKKIMQIKTAGLVDVEFPVEEIILTPEEEKYFIESQRPEKPIEWNFTPEQKALIRKVELKKLEGEVSYHPWYPTNRETLDAWTVGGASKHDYIAKAHGIILPARVPLPYGKQVTLVLDTKILWGKKGRRPGLDKFLAKAVAKYEIVLFGSLQNPNELMPVTNSLIDPNSLYVTYNLYQAMNPDIPYHYWKSVRVLNRPPESCIIVDVNPENVFHNPNNAVIVKEWDGLDFNDRSLEELESFLDYVAKKVVAGGSVTDICPQFHDVDHDLVEIWSSRRWG